MAMKAKTAAAILLAAAVGAVAVWRIWPMLFPPPPLGPVPPLAIAAPPTVNAEALSVGQQHDLTALAARIMGRATPGVTAGTYQHLWPAFYATARFRGQSVIVRFDDSENRNRITIGGGPDPVVIETSRLGAADIKITGLSSGDHDIRFEKLGQHMHPVQFGGFFVEPGAEALEPPEPAARLIEFIGDSDTLGYGNTSPRRACSDDDLYAATDTSKSFGPQVAGRFSADYRVIARSGIGLTRNIDGAAPEYTMPRIYDRPIPENAAVTSVAERAPDIVVIGLGGNDFSSALQPGEPWQDKASLRPAFQRDLDAFAKARMAQYPEARIILLAFGEFGEDLVAPHRAVFEELKAAHGKVDLVVLPKLDRKGCHWHPSPRDHAMIAGMLIEAIETAEPSWKDAPGQAASN